MITPRKFAVGMLALFHVVMVTLLIHLTFLPPRAPGIRQPMAPMSGTSESPPTWPCRLALMSCTTSWPNEPSKRVVTAH